MSDDVTTTDPPSGPRTAGALATDIERRVLNGSLAPGQRLEPVRSLAASLGLAPNTVAAAYRILGDRGVVVGRGRRGTFVAEAPGWAAAPPEQPLAPGALDLGSGNPDPDLLPPLAPATATLDLRPRLYGEPAVWAPLGEALAADLAADGVAPDHLAVVGGALDGLERALNARVRPGDRVVVEDPGYAAVFQLLAAMGLGVVPVPVDRLGVDPEAVATALDAGARAVIVTPRAQNPTGAAFDHERAEALRAVLARHPDVLMVEDDHAGPIAGQPFHHLGPKEGPWVTIRSMAKTLGPDLRVAALVGDEVTVGRVAARQAAGAGWVSGLLQQLVASQLASVEVATLLDRAATAYAQRRLAAATVLTEAGIEVHGRSGLNVWVPVSDEAAVVTTLDRQGLAVQAGSRFRLSSPPGIRLSIGGVDVEAATTAARAVAAALVSGPGSRRA